jgi:AcrR family transcriptional regulator
MKTKTDIRFIVVQTNVQLDLFTEEIFRLRLDYLYTDRYTCGMNAKDEPVTNKQLILQCSLSLFSEKGYEAVGVQEIADAAKITKPTLYHYFGSKRGLLDALIGEYGGKMFERISSVSGYSKDIGNDLLNVAKTLVQFASDNPAFYRMQLAMYFSPPQSEPSEAIKKMNLGVYNLIELLFKNASADHGNMKGRHQAYAATFLGMINTYIGLNANGLVKTDDTTIRKAVHQFMHGIFS